MAVLKLHRGAFYFTTLMALSIGSSLSLFAVTGTWNTTTGLWITAGNVNWSSGPAAYPGQTVAGGDVAIFNNAFPGSNIDCSNVGATPVTLGQIIYNKSLPDLGTLESIQYFFNSGSLLSPATIDMQAGDLLILPRGGGFGTGTLTSNLEITGAPNTICGFIDVNLTGPGSLTYFGAPSTQFVLQCSNSFAGPCTINGGTTLSGNALSTTVFPTNLIVTNGGIIDLQALGVNQFATTSDVFLNSGVLNIHSSLVQQCHSLTIDQNGSATGVGGKLTLNALSSGTALNMKEGTFSISNLTISNGGAIAYNSGLPGMGVATIQNSIIDLGGSNISLNIDDGNVSPTQLFDMDIIDTQFINGRLTKNNLGTLLFEGTNTIVPITLNQGSLLIGSNAADITTVSPAGLFQINPGAILGGFGTLSSAALINNAGYLEPGSPYLLGTLTLNGNYNQTPTGTLVIRLQDGLCDRLVVNNGGVSLNGTLEVNTLDDTLELGDRFLIIDNTLGSGVTGSFANVIDNIPPSLPMRVVINANTVFLEFFNLPPPGPPIVTPTVAELSAMGFSQLNLVNEHTLNLTRRLRSVRYRFEPLAPQEISALYAQADSKKTLTLRGRRYEKKHAITVEPDNSQIEAGRFWKQPTGKPASIYVAPLGSWGEIDRINHQPGSHFHSIGGLIGGDYAFSRAGVGAAIGYEKLDSHAQQISSKMHLHSLFFQAYGTFLPLKNSPLFLDLIAAGSRNWYHQDIKFSQASAAPKGWEYNGYAGLGYDLTLKQEWRMTPLVAMQYIHVKIDDFTLESSCQPCLFVCEEKFHSLRSWAGLSFGGKLERGKVTWMPEVAGYWQHEFADTSHSASLFSPATPLNLPFAQSLPVVTGDRNYGIVGGELRALFGPQKAWTLAGAYNYYWSEHLSMNALYAELGFNF